jgi:HK97 family phage major capsid protein
MEQDPLLELEGNIKSLIDRLAKVEKDSDEYKNGIREIQAKSARLIKGAEGTAVGSLQQDILNGLKTNMEGIKTSMGAKANVKFETKAGGTDMTSFPSGAAASITQMNPRIISPPNRPYHLRELIPQFPCDTGQIGYLNETSIDGGIGPTPFGSIKPQLDFNIQEKLALMQTLAGFVRISAQILDDIPYMMPYLSFRLAENLLLAEDNEILNGTNVSPHLNGLLLSGNKTAKTGSATIFAEKLIQAAAQLAGFNRRVSGIIINPADYYAMLMLAGTGSGVYTVPFGFQVTADGGITVLGVPVIWSNAMTSGTYLVGDFANGVALWIRQMMNIQIFYQDSTNVQQNMVTIRCEERVALTPYSAQAFIYSS